MSDAYIGEIRCFGFNFPPVGWALCNGQLVSIANNTALFSIIGTTYGGDGSTTFGLPNLQGSVPMHWGNGAGGFNTSIGEALGTETATLTTAQIPAHKHTITSVDVGSGGVVQRRDAPSADAWIAPSRPDAAYNKAPTTFTAPFSPQIIGPAGGSQPHENRQPYLVLNFCICTEGIFPARN